MISVRVCGIGGRGQRDARHGGKTLVQQRQLQVFGPEIVAPLRDAMRLVDREQRELRAVQQIEAARGGQPLGRDVEHVELAGEQRALGGPRRIGVERRVEERCAHAQLGQRRDLILHQCDQRRDDDAGALPDERWNLIAQRLAAAGRHEHQRIAAGHDMVDDLALRVAKCGVAKGVAQDPSGSGQGLGHGLVQSVREREPLLAPRLVHGDRDGVRQIEAAHAGPHRNGQPMVRREFGDDGRGEPRGFSQPNTNTSPGTNRASYSECVALVVNAK